MPAVAAAGARALRTRGEPPHVRISVRTAARTTPPSSRRIYDLIRNAQQPLPLHSCGAFILSESSDAHARRSCRRVVPNLPGG